MILEAFSKVLHREYQYLDGSSDYTALAILNRWLSDVLSEASPQDNVSRVIHTEIAKLTICGQTAFAPRSASGEVLLDTLHFYCESYEQWHFSRWLHELKPHHFNSLSR